MKKLENSRHYGFTFILSLLVLLLVILMAVLGPLLAPHSAYIPSDGALLPPSSTHPLGTDDLGIDLWAQICEGAKLSLTVGVCSALIAGIGGALIGIVCGYYGGWVDRLVMRLTDVLIAIPNLPLMIVLGVFFGAGIENIIFVLAIFSWTSPARIARSEVLSIKNEYYVLSAKSYGAGILYLTMRHFLPAVFPVVMVNFIRLINRGIIAEASLSFLGLGDPTAKSWGLILNHALNFRGIYYTEYWRWWLMSPFLAITITVLAVSIMSRETEKLLNVKL